MLLQHRLALTSYLWGIQSHHISVYMRLREPHNKARAIAKTDILRSCRWILERSNHRQAEAYLLSAKQNQNEAEDKRSKWSIGKQTTGIFQQKH